MPTGPDARTDGDLAADRVAELLPDRELRSYPFITSTEADARKWAREGAPEGSLVVADYQIAARGRGGRAWELRPGRGLAFSIVLRPSLPPEREGWLHAVAVSGLADALEDPELRTSDTVPEIGWPDEVLVGTERRGAVALHVELGPQTTSWAVATLFVADATPPRGPLLARTVRAVETRYHQDPQEVLADYGGRCRTLGMKVRVQLMPAGPGGPSLEGLAVDHLEDGALVVETERGNRVGVRPQNLGTIEEAL